VVEAKAFLSSFFGRRVLRSVWLWVVCMGSGLAYINTGLRTNMPTTLLPTGSHVPRD
jgi:hypothetical protein